MEWKDSKDEDEDKAVRVDRGREWKSMRKKRRGDLLGDEGMVGEG